MFGHITLKLLGFWYLSRSIPRKLLKVSQVSPYLNTNFITLEYRKARTISTFFFLGKEKFAIRWKKG